ncbi:MAG TPA: MltA domain-containing protein [Thermodesulfobacteriota bacterium]|nr:MltA domain-containing protein [Thermodesulfobacteriota bacterium]
MNFRSIYLVLRLNICRIVEMRIIPAGFFILCLLSLIISCEKEPIEERVPVKEKAPTEERAPIEQARQAMRLAKPPEILTDDLPPDRLAEGMEENIERLNKLKIQSLTFGPRVVSKEDYILALNYLVRQIRSGISRARFIQTVVNNFDFYEVYGKDKWGEVLITSYYHPVIPGSRTKTSRYSQALYSVPPDLVNIRLDEFVEVIETLSPTKNHALEQISQIDVLRGRLVPSEWGGASTVLPYYTRQEIENNRILEGRNLELAWVDPIDAFFMHIQGSGTVRFQEGEGLRLGYAAKNGHPFVPISKYLSDIIPKGKMSMQAIESYLRRLPKDEQRKILNKNPSYIFFQKLEGKAVTSLGAEVVDGRTIATDQNFFPKGALAYMEFQKPVFRDGASIAPIRWQPTARFVLDQDTGGAIRSPYRVDLYWGSGKEAARHAGVMKNWGRLYYLVPKDEFLQKLSKDSG